MANPYTSQALHIKDILPGFSKMCVFCLPNFQYLASNFVKITPITINMGNHETHLENAKVKTLYIIIFTQNVRNLANQTQTPICNL